MISQPSKVTLPSPFIELESCLRLQRTSNKLVLPLPEGPIIAVSLPLVARPVTFSRILIVPLDVVMDLETFSQSNWLLLTETGETTVVVILERGSILIPI
jgi:hypothetical protein